MRANILASAIGTAVGNPWTFPFIWVWIFHVGRFMGVGEGHENISNLDFSALFGSLTEASLKGDVDTMVEIATPVLLPMLLGSIPTMAVVWLTFYFPLKNLVERYQHRRKRKRIKP